MKPVFWILSAATANSAHVVGILAPAFLNTAGLAHIQFTRCRFTGTAT